MPGDPKGGLPFARVSRRGEERINAGHAWIFGDDLRETPPGASPGDWVRVESRSGLPLGTAMLNLNSRIALRVVSREAVEPGAAFIARRLGEARARRAEAGWGGERAMRLCFSEADALPGLIVDRFADVLSVQILTAGMERYRKEILDELVSVHAPRLVYERSEGGARKHEGLDERKGAAFGEGAPESVIETDGVRFLVDVEKGPKTGFFLDQRANRRIVRDLSAGRRVLDGFCSTGGFGLYALNGGASEVLAVDSSDYAIGAARDNAARNGFAERWEGRAANLFHELRELASAGRRFDLVVLDPPAFAKAREGREGAIRGYRDVNRLGLSLLPPGGLLATASCTQLVDLPAWKEALRLAAADARADLELVAAGGPPPDHPVLLGMPETDYLKFAVWRKRSP
jgi:23S rRNA (cytosine1962-C5)-methyltransferase